MKQKRVLALLSGGLDSSLAAYLVKKQGIEVTGLVFKSYFFDEKKGVDACEKIKIPYKVVDFSKEHLRIVKKPKHGHGKAINPCIDCHTLMLKLAKTIMKNEGYDFVVTGEVLGQRPFSQNMQALGTIAKESGLGNLLLRPLSAKHLSPTLPEKEGWVDRDKLMDIKGRGRSQQLAMAKRIKLEFPQPAGGCLLTEMELAKKFNELVKKQGLNFDGNDAQLLTFGRHYWIGKTRIVLGRNEEENRRLESLARFKDIIVQPANFSGPLALIRGRGMAESTIAKAKKLITEHTNKMKLIKKPIIFIGTSDESVQVLKELLDSDIEIDAVITKPDRPSGRGQKLNPTPLAIFAGEKKIPILKWEKLDKEALIKTEKRIGGRPVLAIVAVYGNLIPNLWLEWADMIINLHPSLLPKWRGAAPVVRTIQAGEKTTGITSFKVVKAMDAGALIDQAETKIKPEETSGELINRLFILGTKRLTKVIKREILGKKLGFWIMKPQDETKVTLANKFEKGEAQIDWSKPVNTICNQIKAFNPFPGAFTFIKIDKNKLRLKIWKARVEKGKLIPEEVQLEGKGKVLWQQFKSAYSNVKLPSQ